jgi:glycine oxidase
VKGKQILIIGQGIAGTCSAWEAERLGMDFTIVDKGSHNSASAVSSGIMNPITGRKFVKSWMSDDFMKTGCEIYEAMSQKYGQQLIHATPMIRHLASIEIENIWDSKSIQEGYSEHMQHGPAKEELKEILNGLQSLGTVVSSRRVDVANLLHFNRMRWLAEGRLTDSIFIEEELEIGKNEIVYNDKAYDALILATGWKGANGKLFETDSYRPAKGEVLLVRIPKMPSEYIIKYNKFIVPQGGDMFWIGTTWQWEFEDAKSESLKSLELEIFLNDLLKLEYEIVSRKAGVRPATKYRKPLIGSHPDHPTIFLLNGLGTKGVTMAPYWARKITEHISSSQLGEDIYFTDAYKSAFK